MEKKRNEATELIIKYINNGWDSRDILDFLWLLCDNQIIDMNDAYLIIDTFNIKAHEEGSKNNGIIFK